MFSISFLLHTGVILLHHIFSLEAFLHVLTSKAILDGNAFGCKKIVQVRKSLFCPKSIMFVLFLLTGHSIEVKEEIIAGGKSFNTRCALPASEQSCDMQLNYHLRHSATGTRKHQNQNPTISLTTSDSNLPYVYDTCILPHTSDFASLFQGLYVVQWRNVLSFINGSLFCFHSGVWRRRERHVHHITGLVLPSAVQWREKQRRAETNSQEPDILKCFCGPIWRVPP